MEVKTSAAPVIFFVGSTVLMNLGGFYGVASADSAQLSLVITDQSNAVIATSTKTVTRGGDSFSMNVTFTVPPGTTQVCRKMVLEIGTATLTAIPSAELLPCIAVGP